jgi:hypothetical protein
LVGIDWHWLVLVGVKNPALSIKFGQTSLSTIPKGTESDSMLFLSNDVVRKFDFSTLDKDGGMHFDKPDIALLFLFCIFTASALML